MTSKIRFGAILALAAALGLARPSGELSAIESSVIEASAASASCALSRFAGVSGAPAPAPVSAAAVQEGGDDECEPVHGVDHPCTPSTEYLQCLDEAEEVFDACHDQWGDSWQGRVVCNLGHAFDIAACMGELIGDIITDGEGAIRKGTEDPAEAALPESYTNTTTTKD